MAESPEVLRFGSIWCLTLPVTKKQLSNKVVHVLYQHKATRHLEKGSYEIYPINIHIQLWSL